MGAFRETFGKHRRQRLSSYHLFCGLQCLYTLPALYEVAGTVYVIILDRKQGVVDRGNVFAFTASIVTLLYILVHSTASRVQRRTGLDPDKRRCLHNRSAMIAPIVLVSMWTASATLAFDRAFKFPTCSPEDSDRAILVDVTKCNIIKANVAIAILLACLSIVMPLAEPEPATDFVDPIGDSGHQKLTENGRWQMSDDGSWTLAGGSPFCGPKSLSCEVNRPSSSRPSTVYNTMQKPRYQAIGPLLFEQDRNEHPANKADTASDYLPSPLQPKGLFPLELPGDIKSPSPLSRSRSAVSPQQSNPLVPRRLSIRRPHLPRSMVAATVASSIYSQSGSDGYDGSDDGASTSSEGDLATASAFTMERVLHPQSPSELPRSRGASKTSRTNSTPGVPISELQAYVQDQQMYQQQIERQPLRTLGSPLSNEHRRRSSSLPQRPPQIKHSFPDYPFLSIDPSSAKQAPPHHTRTSTSIDATIPPPIPTKSPYEHIRKNSSVGQFPASSGGKTELDRRLAEAAANADATAGSRRRSLSGERRKVTKKRQPQ